MNELNILYEDDDIIVVEKPANVPVQSDKSLDLDMVSRLQYYLRKKDPGKKDNYIGLVHRLDRPVSGIMVFGKTPMATVNLNEQIRQGNMKKIYHAEVLGSLPESGCLEHWIFHDTKSNVSRIVDKESGGKLAKLEYTRLDTYEWNHQIVSKVRINLLTGRHHQIRVQFAYNNTPLIGDTKYNKNTTHSKEHKGLKLQAVEIMLWHPTKKISMKFSLENKGL